MAKRSKTSTKDLYDAPKKESYGVANRGDGRTPRIKHERPEVARHVARMLVAANMDYEVAVSKMMSKEFPDITDAQIVQLARTLEKSPHVQRELAAYLEEIGAGVDAQKKLIGLLWGEAFRRDPKTWGTAARLLTEITGAAKAAGKNDKPPALRLDGMEEGLSKMLGDSAPQNDVDPDVPEEPAIELEEEPVSDATGYAGEEDAGDS